MRKKELKKAAAALLAGTMLLGGCSKPADTSQNSTDGTGDAPIEIRVFSTYDPNAETPASKFLVQEMEKALNIKLIRDEVPQSAYKEKLQLALADGDYPDVFIFNAHDDSMLISAVDNGLVIPVNDYIKDMENIQKYTYPQAFETAKIKNDDNIYLIPRTTVARSDGFAVRKDWMEKLGIEITSDNYSMTPDAFLDMLKKFAADDPDGDGQNNTYGLQYRAINGNMDVFYAGVFGCLGWEKSDGEYQYMNPMYEIGNEKYKKALEYSRNVYQYAHPDSAITSEVGLNEVGAFPYFAGHISNLEDNVQALVPEAELTYISGIADESGKVQELTDIPGIWGGLAVTTACEHPEKVAEMIDWLLSDQAWEYSLYGEPGVSYNKAEDGTIEIVEEEYKKNKEKNANWATEIVRRKESVDFFLDLSQPEEELTETRNWLNVAVDSVVMPIDNGKKPECAKDTVFIEAENKLKEVRTKVIMGVMEVSEYDAALADWYEKGGRTYVEEMNKLIAQTQG